VLFKLYGIRERLVLQLPEKHTGIYRQGFILLMTLFDSTVFDLARFALQRNFFGLIATFGKKEKASYEWIGQHRDFDALRESIIDELLKQRYIKDLLFEFSELGVTVTGDVGEGFPRLIEMVLRRNIHLHNRGRVDGRYLEGAECGRPKWNLDGLELGEYARIDREYWIRASDLCGRYVDRLASWITKVLHRTKTGNQWRLLLLSRRPRAFHFSIQSDRR
jgi:hypothetical protein